jgi:hypothetical protein
MVLQIHAQIKNGELIPRVPISLPDTDDVILTISDPARTEPVPAIRDDPHDPCPEGGLALLEWFGRHRVTLDPDLLRDIIESPDYLDQEPQDEP